MIMSVGASVKKILRATGPSLVTFVIAMLAAEIYFRHQQPSAPIELYGLSLYTHDGRRVSPSVGSLKLALAPFTIYRNLPSQKTTAFTINSRGLRAAEGVEQDSAPKIIFLGASAAFGYLAQTDEETISSRLEQSMKPYRVLNAGVVAFLSGQELSYLATELIDYRPAIVVAYDGWNDLRDSVYRDRKENELGYIWYFFDLEENQLQQNYQTQVSPSKAFIRFAEAVSTKSRLLTRIREKIKGNPPEGHIQHRELLDPVVQNYAANLRKMSLISHAHGAEFVVVFQPELGQKPHLTPAEEQCLAVGSGSLTTAYRKEFPALYREFLAKTKQQLDKDKVEWIDINESDKYRENVETLFLDVVHTNRRGNEIVAEIIAPRLRVLADRNSKPAVD